MRHLSYWTVQAGAEQHFATQFASSGYLTNASLYQYTAGAFYPDQPVSVLISPEQDVNNQMDYALSDGIVVTNFPKGKNSFEATFGNVQDTDASLVQVNFKHFRNKYVILRNRTFLQFTTWAEGDLAAMAFLFQADFIPFKGAQFKERYTVISFEPDRDYERGYPFPLDMEDVTATITMVLTAGSGVLDIMLFSKASELNPDTFQNFSDDVSGDVFHETHVDAQEIAAAQNQLAMIPFSSTIGASTVVVDVGTVSQGDHIGFDWYHGQSLAGTMHVLFSGKVRKQYYSRGSRVVLSPHIHNSTKQGLLT